MLTDEGARLLAVPSVGAHGIAQKTRSGDVMRLTRQGRAFAIAGAITLAVCAATAARAAPHATCTRYASPSGVDSAPGTKAHPLQDVQDLVDRLSAGQTGCLLAGTYVEDVSVRRGGRAGAPVTLRGAPGVTATVRGRFWIANGANYVTVSYLHLDGRNATNLPSPTINADHSTFVYDDVTNNHAGGVNDGDGICFALGDANGVWGLATYTVIAHNTIHDCGTSNNHNHGVYVAAGRYVRITDNWIYNNADRGVQLYPDAQHTLVRNNVIAGNGDGVIISGNWKFASSNNTVIDNVIIDSRNRYNVEYNWSESGPVGTGNVVAQNCLSGGKEGNILEPQKGYAASQNLFVAPEFVGSTWPTRLRAHSACARFAPRP
jgi:parallel beta helix pectate lyase-like protein